MYDLIQIRFRGYLATSKSRAMYFKYDIGANLLCCTVTDVRSLWIEDSAGFRMIRVKSLAHISWIRNLIGIMLAVIVLWRQTYVLDIEFELFQVIEVLLVSDQLSEGSLVQGSTCPRFQLSYRHTVRARVIVMVRFSVKFRNLHYYISDKWTLEQLTMNPTMNRPFNEGMVKVAKTRTATHQNGDRLYRRLECRLWVPVHCLQSNGVIIHMTSRHTLHITQLLRE